MQAQRLSFALPFAGISLLVVLVLAYFLTTGYQDAVRAAERAGHNEAHILANRFGAILDHASADFDFIAEHIAPPLLVNTPDQSAHAPDHVLTTLTRAFPEIQGYFIVDPEGRNVFGSTPLDAIISVEDCECLEAVKAAPDTSNHYSKVVISRLDGNPTLIFYRAVLHPSGRFAGLVLAPINLEKIADLFSKLELGHQGIASIRRADDSRLVVRNPHRPAEVNQPAPETAPFLRILQGDRQGVTRNPGKVDAVDRVFNFQVVDHHPFYVLIGRATDEVLAPWRVTAAIALLFALAVFCAAALMLARLHQRADALREREAIMSAIVGQASDAIELTDLESLRFIEFNDAACALLGYTREEYAQLRVPDIQDGLSAAELARILDPLQPGDRVRFENRRRKKSGELIDVQVSLTCILRKDRRHLTSIWSDITDRRRREQLLALRHELIEQLRLGDQQQLLRKALDAAESLTHSRIGFLHFIEDDQQSVSLQVWSSNTLAQMCCTPGQDAHYPVSKAGVWVDCIHQRKPVVHNDYAALPHRKGLPAGHAGIVREATAPLLRDGRVVAVIGVGNKASDYVDADVAVITEIIEMVFDFVERQRAEQQVEFMAYHDTLTRLPNRSLILDQIGQAIGQCRRSNALVVVGYVNLDGFKPINEHYGYAIGDAVLLGVARSLKESLRQGDSLARVGGDEFVVMLTGLSNADECDRAMQRVHDELNRTVDAHGHLIEVLASIGATLFPLDDAGPDALVHHAHHAMFQAKRAGPANYRLYDPVQEQQLRQHRRIRDELAVALAHDQLVLFYQPKISLADGQVVGVEALVRWQHPEHGLLPPGDFLPQIENTPLDIQLGEWVLRNAMAQLCAWLAAGIRLGVSVNISPQHLQSRGFADALEAVLSTCPPEATQLLELEILEVASIDNADHTSAVMHACKKLGVRFSLDDFGTGYSSLTHFHNLPIDIVKVDQRFVRGMLERPSDRDIVQGVLRLAEHLKRPVVAEGVESIEIGRLLLDLGCHYAQGFGIARPMPADQIPLWLADWHSTSPWHRLGQPHATGRALDLVHHHRGSEPPETPRT